MTGKCMHCGHDHDADLLSIPDFLRNKQNLRDEHSAEERILRYLLFSGHGHNGSSACLYGDDGEMQCGICFCDFVRDTPDELQRKIERWNIQECIRLGIIKVTVSGANES